jgi:hypothetical protein
LHERNEHPRSDEMPWLTWKESAQQLIEQLDNARWAERSVSEVV